MIKAWPKCCFLFPLYPQHAMASNYYNLRTGWRTRKKYFPETNTIIRSPALPNRWQNLLDLYQGFLEGFDYDHLSTTVFLERQHSQNRLPSHIKATSFAPTSTWIFIPPAKEVPRNKWKIRYPRRRYSQTFH
jgi:hypothetical protein